MATFTVTVDTNIDSVSYAANESHTINAGVTLTVNRDCNTTGTSSTSNYPYFGNTTCDGTLAIDGNVLEIGVSSTSGAAIGSGSISP